MTPITTLEKLGDVWEVPFLGSFRGSGNLLHLVQVKQRVEASLCDSRRSRRILGNYYVGVT